MTRRLQEPSISKPSASKSRNAGDDTHHNDAHLNIVFKALADPGRRLLLDRLHGQSGQTLGQLCQYLEMSRQAVTKHLRLLERASLVVTQWRGREKLHYLNPVPIHEVAERWIGKYERGRLRALAELKKRLEGEN
jgi:DNA-binding transcriptional ArsR family regulator